MEPRAINRRQVLTGAGALGLATGAVLLASVSPASATSGIGGQGALVLGSNNVSAPGPAPNTANVASAATVLEAAPNFGNYAAYGAYILAVDARPSQIGNIDGLQAYARGTGTGVFGSAASTGTGVFGTAVGNGTGVFGSSSGGVGVGGTSDSGSGVTGISPTGNGVSGASGGGPGVKGTSQTGIGVFGDCDGTSGVGVLARSPGIALQVKGRANFSKSGKLVVPPLHSSVAKTGLSLASTAMVMATIQGNVAGIYVQGVTVTPGASGSFTIHLNKAAPENVSIAWFVLE